MHKSASNNVLSWLARKNSALGIKIKRYYQLILVKPEVFFITLAAFFGIIIVFLVPPFQAPDEQSHFYRSFEISNLEIFPQKLNIDGHARYGSVLPTSLKQFESDVKSNIAGNPAAKFNLKIYKQYIGQKLDPANKTSIAFEGAAVYSPIAYVPQVVGMSAGKLLGLSPLLIFWLGRIANLAFFILLSVIAIRLLPFAKWALVFVLMNPMTLFLAASLSGDALIIAAATLYTALVLKLASKKEMISKKEMVYAIILLCILALTKPTNIVFGLLLLLIPIKSFANKKAFFGFLAIALGLSLLVLVAWNLSVKDALQAVGAIQRQGLNINPIAQAHFILSNPITYIKDLVHNYVIITSGYSGSGVFWSYFGVFGWLDSSLPLWTVSLYMVGLLIAILYQIGRGVNLMVWQKIVLLISLLSLSLITITALYANYTPVGQNIIDGIQGRYFIPFALVGTALFLGDKKILQISNKKMGVVAAIILSIVFIVTLAILALRYYK